MATIKVGLNDTLVIGDNDYTITSIKTTPKNAEIGLTDTKALEESYKIDFRVCLNGETVASNVYKTIRASEFGHGIS